MRSSEAFLPALLKTFIFFPLRGINKSLPIYDLRFEIQLNTGILALCSGDEVFNAAISELPASAQPGLARGYGSGSAAHSWHSPAAGAPRRLFRHSRWINPALPEKI